MDGPLFSLSFSTFSLSCSIKRIETPARFFVQPEIARAGGGIFYAFNTSINASCGMFTLPMDFIRFLPSFCFSSSLRLRDTSPP